MLRQKKAAGLDAWLERAAASLLASLYTNPTWPSARGVRKCLRHAASGYSQRHLMRLGNSKYVGEGAGPVSPNYNLAGEKVVSPPAQIAKYLAGKGVPTSQASFIWDKKIAVSVNSTFLPSYDPRFTQTTGWGSNANESVGGHPI